MSKPKDEVKKSANGDQPNKPGTVEHFTIEQLDREEEHIIAEFTEEYTKEKADHPQENGDDDWFES